MDHQPVRTMYLAYITAKEYPLFRRGLPPDARLPETYDEWVQQTIDEHATHRLAGHHTEPVVVRWDDLLKYADLLGLAPSYSLLTALAVHRGRNQQQPSARRVE